MARDMLLAHPQPEGLHILPTARDPKSNLALSSRNVYLSLAESVYAPCLFNALTAGKAAWEKGGTREDVIAVASQSIVRAQREAEEKDSVEIKFDYVELCDAETFEMPMGRDEEQAYILSGAIWIGKTRLIDNLILGNAS